MVSSAFIRPVVAYIFAVLLLGSISCSNSPPSAASEASELHIDEVVDPHGTVRPPESARNAFAVAPVGEADDTVRTMIPAVVQFRDAATSAVTSPVEGRVESIHVSTGQTVKKGDPLINVRSVELLNMQAALRGAQTRLRLAKDTLDRQERLDKDGVAVPAELIEAKTNLNNAQNDVRRIRSVLKNVGSKRTENLTLHAPRDGVLLERNVVVGDAVGPESGALMRVGDTNSLWMVAQVFDGDLGRVVPDSRVRIHLPGGLVETYGHVSRIGAVVDSTMRRAPVWIELDDTEGLRPGMMGQAALQLRTDGAMRLPPTAVLLTEDGEYRTWVEVEPGAYRPRSIVVGQTRHGLVEIMSGLEAGERVVVEGALLLDASASMRL